MVPKKSNDIIKKTAQDLGVSEDIVDAVKSFYWREVRKSMTEMRYHSIFVENLGTFKVKSWKLEELLDKYTNYISCTDTRTFNRMALRLDTEDRISKIKNLLTMLEDEVKKKQSVKDKRYGEQSK